MELIILTNVSIILILFLLLSFINEHLGFEKFSLKKKKLIISVVLLVVNLREKASIFIFILLALLFLIPSSCIILIFALRGLPHG
ncbi:hypothetical protein KST12_02905 [Fusobacterium polymorphum]|jgi:hypothetical protein|uniref:Uncharacterized protein n=1 Tax=Fusobacterium nucleatum TaxID=851 RepID=A0A3P1VT90_FUSNU|nr:hypothetical protein [Fusobacterium nucleatum]RRD37572.1 hypothetical protein EII28_05095 [Fusobacterium nucleatum]BEO92443.1 hypothetical protein FNCP4_16550 [Fusobacterium nucleatum]BEP04518.1 hypothetical protein FNSP4_22520 [Fusobacterium nucleatum]